MIVPVVLKLETLQVMRGLAALMVVLFHMEVSIWPGIFHISQPFFSGFEMGSAGVEVFFVISGFIMWHIHHDDWGLAQKFLPFLYKRATRIYPLYLFVFGITVFFYFLFPAFGSARAQHWGSVLYDAALLPTEGYPLLVVAWTLQYEMFFYMMFAISLLNRYWGVMLAGMWMLGCTINLFMHTQNFWLAFFFSPLNFLFVLGCLAAQIVQTRRLVFPHIIGIMGVILFFVIGINKTFHLLTIDDGLQSLLYGVVTCMIFGFIQVEEKINFKNYFFRPFVLMGTISYSLYLVHCLAMTVFGLILIKFSLVQYVPLCVLFFLPPIAALMSGLMCFWWVEHPLQRFFKGLGEKFFSCEGGRFSHRPL